MGQKRDTFSSKLGFIFAAAGSAVGLGNLEEFSFSSTCCLQSVSDLR